MKTAYQHLCKNLISIPNGPYIAKYNPELFEVILKSINEGRKEALEESAKLIKEPIKKQAILNLVNELK